MKRMLLLSPLLAGCVQLDAIDSAGSSSSEVPPRVQDVLDEQCATAGCHDASSRAGGLSLAAADSAALLSGATSNQEPSLALVERGSIDSSYLAIKLLAEPPEGRSRQGERMPLGGSSNPDDIALLLGWIAGAEVGDEVGPDEDATSGGESTGAEPEEPGPSEPSGGVCSVDRLASSGEASIDAGMDAEQIPAVIGEVLTSNCGCHLADTLVPEASSYALQLPFDLTTLQGWRGSVDGRSASDVVNDRVVAQGSMPPAYACDDGSGETMPAADRDLLADWIAADLPGGDAWP